MFPHTRLNRTEYALTDKEALSDSDERTAVKVQYLHETDHRRHLLEISGFSLITDRL